jgi:YVTN family beta-propeller protein
MKSLVLSLACAVSLMVGAIPAAAGECLLVVNRGSGDISFLDVATNDLAGTLPISTDGRLDDVAASPDGEVIFVNAQLDRDDGPGLTPGGEILAISTRTGGVLWRQRVAGIPHHLTVSADGSELFVPLFDAQRIEVLDTRTGAPVGTMFSKWGMHTTRLSEDGSKLYAGSIFTGQIYVFDVSTRELVQSLSLSGGEFGGIGVRPFSVTADDSTIYSQLSGFHGLVVMDVANNRITEFLRHNDLPSDFKYPEFPYNVDHGLELSPDGKMLVAVSESTRQAYIFSVDPLVLQKKIPVGRISKWVSFSSSGEYAYISNSGDNDVSVISMSALEEVARVPTGGVGGALMRVVRIPDGNMAQLMANR